MANVPYAKIGRRTYQWLASAARTTSGVTASADIDTGDYKGISVYWDVTDSAATPSVVLTIQGKDPLSGDYYTILAGAAVTGASNNRYFVFPGAPVSANVSANDQLPDVIRLILTAADGDSLTSSVSFTLLP